MTVCLYRVGRNLNRAYRTCEAFGVDRLELVECDDSRLSGNLFGARDRVKICNCAAFPPKGNLLALDTFFQEELGNVDWKRVCRILIGGETTGLPVAIEAEQKARIPMVGRVSGLTVEASLAIALYEWRRYEDRRNN